MITSEELSLIKAYGFCCLLRNELYVVQFR